MCLEWSLPSLLPPTSDVSVGSCGSENVLQKRQPVLAVGHIYRRLLGVQPRRISLFKVRLLASSPRALALSAPRLLARVTARFGPSTLGAPAEEFLGALPLETFASRGKRPPRVVNSYPVTS